MAVSNRVHGVKPIIFQSALRSAEGTESRAARQCRLVASRFRCVDAIILVTTQEIAMPLNIRNERVNQLAEKLAVRKRLNKAEAVKFALENELRRLEKSQPLRERLRALQNRVLAWHATGLEADKDFYDDLSGPA